MEEKIIIEENINNNLGESFNRLCKLQGLIKKESTCRELRNLIFNNYTILLLFL